MPATTTEPLGVETLTFRGRPRRHFLRYTDGAETLVQEFQADGTMLGTYPASEHDARKRALLDVYRGRSC